MGDPADGTGASSAGIVYVYGLSGSSPPVRVATLLDPGPSAGDVFGHAVAMSGARMVVVARGVGNAYVYDLASATPTIVAILNDPMPEDLDSFGSSVAISGPRVVVGGSGGSATGAPDAGIAYVYDLGSATPTTPVMTLVNPVPEEDDKFGSAVSISGTLVVVGADRDDAPVGDAGSAYLYDLASAAPTLPVATLRNPEPVHGGNFGSSAAMSGTRVVIGAKGSGRVYVYDLAGATPAVPVTVLDNPSPAPFDQFGFSVAISGTRVVVGAYQDERGATDTGSAYVYDLGGATPTTPVATLPEFASPEMSFSGFGILSRHFRHAGGSRHSLLQWICPPCMVMFGCMT